MTLPSKPYPERRAEARTAVPVDEIVIEEARGKRLAVVKEICLSGMSTEVHSETDGGKPFFEEGRSYSLFLVAEREEMRVPVRATVLRLEGSKIAFSLRRDGRGKAQLDRLLSKIKTDCPDSADRVGSTGA